MRYPAVLCMVLALSPAAADVWSSPPTLAACSPLTLPLTGGKAVVAQWVRYSGGDQPATVTIDITPTPGAKWLTIAALSAGGGEESITLRAVTAEGVTLTSRPLPLPDHGWLTEAVRLEQAPTILAQPATIKRIEIASTNRKAHHLVVTALAPTADSAVPLAPRLDLKRAAAVTGPGTQLTAVEHLEAARWAWILGDVASAEQTYSEILRTDSGTAISAFAELERALLPGIGRSPSEWSTMLHAASARTVADAVAGQAALLLAAHCREQGNLDRALRALEPLTHTECPQGLSAPAWEESARILLAMGDPQRCWEALARAQAGASMPGEIGALRRRVRGWLSDAFSLRALPQNGPLGREQAWWSGSTVATPESYRAADGSSFFAPQALLDAAESHRAAGDLSAALAGHQALSACGATDPDVAARAALYVVYCGGPESEHATPALRQLIMDYPSEARIVGAAYLNLGERLARQGDLRGAVAALHRVAGARPGVLTFDLQAARRLAECYDRIGDPDASGAQWRHALAIAQSRTGVAEFDEVARMARDALGLGGAMPALTTIAAPRD